MGKQESDPGRSIEQKLTARLSELYTGPSKTVVQAIGELLAPHISGIVEGFYDELLRIPEIYPILENKLVKKNLRQSLGHWIRAFFTVPQPDIGTMVRRQKDIGAIHAHINLKLNYFNYGLSILKQEIYQVLTTTVSLSPARFAESFVVIGELFDILSAFIAESYFSNELVHESNAFSLKVKGITQNAAIECERLRSMLLDWLRNSLTFLYQSPQIELASLPRLQYSNFGLWVIYKSDLLSHTLNVSSELKEHIARIDHALFEAARYRMNGKQERFFDAVSTLNDLVTQTSWHISTIVDQALELDTGMDPLTRLFNRRYLNTILRRQTEISRKQGLPYAVLLFDLDHFKAINDRYGHDSGDAVLKQFSELILISVRSSDFIFRYGGEEFLIVLGNVEQHAAWRVAEDIREKCQGHRFQIPDHPDLHLTCSVGIAIHDGHPDYNRLITQADAALYQAKEGGRNRSVMG